MFKNCIDNCFAAEYNTDRTKEEEDLTEEGPGKGPNTKKGGMDHLRTKFPLSNETHSV